MKTYEPSWANYLSDAVTFWEQFASSKAYSSVFATPRKGTELSVYLNGKLHRHLDDIHQSVVEKDFTNLPECLSNLDLAVSNLADFAENWRGFLGLAASGISKHHSHQKYDERRHAITTFLSPEGEELNWVPWEAMHREPRRLDELAHWLVSVFADIDWEFDLVCALSNTADPLGTLVMVKSRKPLVAIDNDEHTCLPPSPSIFRDKRVLLIDTLVRTGDTYRKAKEALTQLGATVTGGFFVVHNDMSADRSFDPKNERKVICLYQFSEIYVEWLAQLGDGPPGA